MNGLINTPLYDLHRELGARMTGFGGFNLPLQYRGILHEHLHCRSSAGLFDISHMGQCRILGENADALLERLTPGGLVYLAVGQQKYTVLTNPDGGVIDDIIATRIDGGFNLIVNASRKAVDFDYLRDACGSTCRFEVVDRALLALQGPNAATVMARFSETATRLRFMHACETDVAGIACWVSRSGYTGEDGFEISVDNDDVEKLARRLLAEAEVEPVGLGARDTLRLEAGLCLYGHELTESISPIEAGLKWLFKKGHTDFPGAGVILPQLANGTARRRVGLLVDGKQPVREGAVLYAGEASVGYVTSGGYSPTLGRPVAMAMLELDSASVGSLVHAFVRDVRIIATVCRLPFVPHRYQRG